MLYFCFILVNKEFTRESLVLFIRTYKTLCETGFGLWMGHYHKWFYNYNVLSTLSTKLHGATRVRVSTVRSSPSSCLASPCSALCYYIYTLAP